MTCFKIGGYYGLVVLRNDRSPNYSNELEVWYSARKTGWILNRGEGEISCACVSDMEVVELERHQAPRIFRVCRGEALKDRIEI